MFNAETSVLSNNYDLCFSQMIRPHITKDVTYKVYCLGGEKIVIFIDKQQKCEFMKIRIRN